MQVRFLGFRLEIASENLTLEEFAAAVSAQSPNQNNGQNLERLLFLNNEFHSEYHVGMIVTAKNQKTFCRLFSKDGSLLVKVEELELDTQLMEFNFFVINKITGAGLYQYYHHSCSLSGFGGLLASCFQDYKDKLIQEATDKIPLASRSESAIKKIRQKFKGVFKWELLVRKENLQALLAAWTRLKSYEWTIATPTVGEKEFKPLEPYIRNQRSKLGFEGDAPVAALASAITAQVARLGILKGRIEGQDSEGLDRVLHIVNNPENYGEYDYDDLAEKLHDLDLNKFQNAWVVTELIETCKKLTGIFETPMQP